MFSFILKAHKGNTKKHVIKHVFEIILLNKRKFFSVKTKTPHNE